MKHSTKYALATFFGLLFAFSTVTVQAQDQPKVKVTVPFDFVVGSKELKAGEYVVQRYGVLGSQNLQFRSKDGDVAQTAFTVPIETNKSGDHERLVFHRYGDQYFLSQVWFAGDDGHEFIPGAREKKAATENSAADQVVAGQ